MPVTREGTARAGGACLCGERPRLLVEHGEARAEEHAAPGGAPRGRPLGACAAEATSETRARSRDGGNDRGGVVESSGGGWDHAAGREGYSTDRVLPRRLGGTGRVTRAAAPSDLLVLCEVAVDEDFPEAAGTHVTHADARRDDEARRNHHASAGISRAIRGSRRHADRTNHLRGTVDQYEPRGDGTRGVPGARPFPARSSTAQVCAWFARTSRRSH